MVTNTGDEAVLIHKDTTLGQSELVATNKIQNISTLKSRKSPKLTDKKDAKYDLKLVKTLPILASPWKQKQSSLN